MTNLLQRHVEPMFEKRTARFLRMALTLKQIPRVDQIGDAGPGDVTGVSVVRFSWNAAVNALFAATLLFAEVAAFGLAMVWSVVQLLNLPSMLIPGLGAIVIAGSAMAGTWLYRAAYAAEILNRLEITELGPSAVSHRARSCEE